MATTSGQDSSFNILGSSKLNTADGKNPTSSSTTAIQGQTAGAKDQASATGGLDKDTACRKAHDELEARLRDEELSARSRGW